MSIAVACGGKVHLYPVQQVTRQRGESTFSGLKAESKGRREFSLPNIATTGVTASQTSKTGSTAMTATCSTPTMTHNERHSTGSHPARLPRTLTAMAVWTCSATRPPASSPTCGVMATRALPTPPWAAATPATNIAGARQNPIVSLIASSMTLASRLGSVCRSARFQSVRISR